MRASRQTELQREFPLHVVCSWLGNSPRIAQQSYLLVTEDDFQGGWRSEGDGGGVSASLNRHFQSRGVRSAMATASDCLPVLAGR